MAVTQKSYVDSQPAVKKARETLSKAQAALNQAKLALSNTPSNLKDLVKSNTAAVDAAQKAFDKAKFAVTGAELDAKNYYTKNKASIEAEASKGKTDEEKLATLKETRDRAAAAGAPTAGYEGPIKDLESKIAAAKKKTTGTETGKSTASAEAPAKLRDYAAEITTAGRAVAEMKDADRLALSTALSGAGYSVTPSGNYSDALISAYTQALADNQIRSTNFNKEIPLQEFLTLRKSENVGAGVGGAGGPSTTIDRYPTITNEQDARITINKYFQDKLGRDATDSEFKAAYKEVVKQQKAKPTTRKTVRDAAGNVTYTTTGGTNTEDILNQFVASKSKLQEELSAYEASDAATAKRQQDRKAYEKLAAAAAGDPAKMAALANTAYGKDLAYVRRKVEEQNITAGGALTPEEMDAIAKEAVDQAQDSNIYQLKSFIDSKLKFGAGKEGVYKGAAGENVDALTKVAAANGVDLQKAFGSNLPDWLNAINKGESIETYKKIIRDVAKIGMPEKVAKLIDQGIDLSAIYAPYRNIMANTLEINPATIDMNDSTLRSAITAEKEVPLYEFERALRNDNRWQYTNQAKEEVSNATRQILRDFGFMG